MIEFTLSEWDQLRAIGKAAERNAPYGMLSSLAFHTCGDGAVSVVATNRYILARRVFRKKLTAEPQAPGTWLGSLVELDPRQTAGMVKRSLRDAIGREPNPRVVLDFDYDRRPIVSTRWDERLRGKPEVDHEPLRLSLMRPQDWTLGDQVAKYLSDDNDESGGDEVTFTPEYLTLALETAGPRGRRPWPVRMRTVIPGGDIRGPLLRLSSSADGYWQAVVMTVRP